MATRRPKIARLYLAHPILLRREVRAEELLFEERTGIELVNPFYDGAETSAIAPLDSGEIDIKEYATRLEHNGLGEQFVKEDLRNIAETDGIVAFIKAKVPTVGTSMEIWEAYKTGKRVYIVTDFAEHIWLKYVADESGGYMVESLSQLADLLAPNGRARK
jgi:nucleoside 2-deoxyribosyltransferase